MSVLIANNYLVIIREHYSMNMEQKCIHNKMKWHQLQKIRHTFFSFFPLQDWSTV
jgi:hypothetical protein